MAIAVAARYATARSWGALGLTAGYAERFQGLFEKSFPLAVDHSGARAMLGLDAAELQRFQPEEQGKVLHWLSLLRAQDQGLRLRPWRRPPLFAFVSYVWADDRDVGMASRIAAACDGAGIPNFLDKTGVESKEGSWRMQVATGLGKATHLLLGVSPGLGTGGVVIRELEMALHRWAMDGPAIICVASPEVSDQLCSDHSVPLIVRFAVTFCPRMTPEEAATPDLIRYVLERTRRQGKLRDLLAFVSPCTLYSQLVRLPGIAQSVGSAETQAEKVPTAT